MKNRTLGVLALAIAAACSIAQQTSTGPLADKPNGMRRADSTWVALVGCTLHPRPGEVMAHASVVFRDGMITAVLPGEAGPDGVGGTADDVAGRVPIGPRVVDCSGLHVYAAFIEPYLEIDVPTPDASDTGRHWNASVTPQRSAASVAQNVAPMAEGLRKLGFGAACLSPRGGIFRGRSALVSLAKASDDANAAADKPPVYLENAYNALSLETAAQGYPDSQMGSIALIRQTLSDADWQQQQRTNSSGEKNSAQDPGAPNCLDYLSTHALGTGGQPVATSLYYLFDCADELEELRALKIAKEWNRAPYLLGSGTEYQRLSALGEALKGSHAGLTYSRPAVVVPLNFPQSPEVSTPGKVEQVELRDLMSWEQAPTNPRRLAAAGIDFALTTHRLRNRNDFPKNLQRAMAHGLTEDQALSALTTRPAAMLGVSNQLGEVREGMRANILVVDGPVFAKKNADGKSVKIREVWIDGQRHEITPPPGPELEGTWALELTNAVAATRSLVFDKDNGLTLKRNDKTVKGERVSVTNSSVSFTFDHEPLNDPKAEPPGPKGIFTMSGLIERDAKGKPAVIRGTGLRSGGERFTFVATRQEPSALVGAWRVSEADGTAKDPQSKDQLDMTITGAGLTLRFTYESKDPITIKADEFKWGEAPSPQAGPTSLSFTHELKKLGMEGKSSDVVRLEGETLMGESTLPDGSKHAYKAKRKPEEKPKEEDEKDPGLITQDVPEKLGLPFGPYAIEKMPDQIDAVIRHATIWTNTGEPIVDGVLAISKGKIAFVGTEKELGDWFQKGVKLRQPWVEIDATGKHITPGIIDCHSHTGISRGVNEAGRSVSAEVRIADVTDPDSISWYRQLAGGVTAVNSLHGSANAIGGQSQTNKNRWGCLAPDDMHFEGAKPGIKFALGENPTQMNGSGRDRSRYPITRMGVETLIRDRFTQAREYARRRGGEADKRSDNEKGTPRRDLQLEALAEILAGERLVHCHSYRQDEIVMLTQVARDFGFNIGTFQHILEGYKVADYVRDYSGGGSGFTDWWAYKIEVQDAIPFAFPLMHEVGVTTSFNSDSDELARRLNVEAAKAVKYSNGRISPAEALKFVTLNPAKQLMVDSRVGTLEAGKDADFAVWSGDPLSAFTKCERTFVDGRELFSMEQDEAHRARIAGERTRIIQKLLTKPKREKPEGEAEGTGEGRPDGVDSPQPRRGRRRPPNEMTSGAQALGAGGEEAADDATEASTDEAVIRRRMQYLDLINRGLDPAMHRPGECGCGVLN